MHDEYEETAFIRVGLIGSSEEGLIVFSFKWSPKMTISELENEVNTQIVPVAGAFGEEFARLVENRIRETMENPDRDNPE